MAMFIQVEVNPKLVSNKEVARKLADVCPVDIFALSEKETLEITEENVDECTLCDLCVEATSPDTVKIVKLYETD